MNKIFIHNLALLFVLATLQLACSHSRETESYGKDVFVISGTMHYMNIEMGCWQFTADDSSHYEITRRNAQPLFKEGLRAKIAVRALHGAASTCMVGKIVELVDIVEIHN